MLSILQKIIENKKLEVKALRHQYSTVAMHELIARQTPCRGFVRAIEKKIKKQQNALIAECKKASPSQGVIIEQYHAAKIAKEYEKAGASCLSILTDESFFQGKIEDLQEARMHTQLPIIRKDFIIDPLQILHSRAIGADCILLIVAALSVPQLKELFHCATEVGIDVLVETHNFVEVDIANQLCPRLLGINNRDLNTFKVDLQTTLNAKNFVSSKSTIITESGIKTKADIQRMNDNGIYAFLVGESLMRQASPGEALKTLCD